MANPQIQPTPLSQAYGTPLQAAMAALAQAKAEKVPSNEWAGAVFKNAQGQYQYTLPQQGSEEHFNLALHVPKSDTLSALYHTHPTVDSSGRNIGQDSDELFSPNDVNVANQLKVPSYIWTGYDGKEREYIPGQTPTMEDEDANDADDEGGRISKGVIVQPPAPPITAQTQAPSPLANALIAATQRAANTPTQ